jgi:hypothetical protein
MATGAEAQLPGAELVEQGLADLASGDVSVEALLLSRFASRLAAVGVPIDAPLEDPDQRLYELLADSQGAAAHGAYNALTRRIVSYMRAAESARSR